MGRNLSVEKFGELSVLLSVFTLAGFPYTAISTFVTREATLLIGRSPLGPLRPLSQYALRVLFPASIAFALVLAVGGYYGSGYFNVSAIEVVLFSLASVAGYFFQIQASFLQARSSFGKYSFLNVLQPAIKFTVGVLLIQMGFGLYAIAFTIAASALVATVWARWWNREFLRGPGETQFRPLHGSPRQFLGSLVLSNLLLVLYGQLDLVMSRRILEPTLAGLFAAASFFGKLVIFLPGILSVAIVPWVASATGNKTRQLKILAEIVALDLALSIPYLLLLGVFSAQLVDAVLGAKYTGATSLVLVYGLACLPLNLLMILCSYSQARGSRLSWLGPLVGLALFILLSNIWVTSGEMLLNALLASATAGFAIQLVAELYSKDSSK